MAPTRFADEDFAEQTPVKKKTTTPRTPADKPLGPAVLSTSPNIQTTPTTSLVPSALASGLRNLTQKPLIVTHPNKVTSFIIIKSPQQVAIKKSPDQTKQQLILPKILQVSQPDLNQAKAAQVNIDSKVQTPKDLHEVSVKTKEEETSNPIDSDMKRVQDKEQDALDNDANQVSPLNVPQSSASPNAHRKVAQIPSTAQLNKISSLLQPPGSSGPRFKP